MILAFFIISFPRNGITFSNPILSFKLNILKFWKSKREFLSISLIECNSWKILLFILFSSNSYSFAFLFFLASYFSTFLFKIFFLLKKLILYLSIFNPPLKLNWIIGKETILSSCWFLLELMEFKLSPYEFIFSLSFLMLFSNIWLNFFFNFELDLLNIL